MAHYESTQTKCCSFQLLEESQVPKGLQHVGSPWSNSGRTLQLLSLWVYKKHGCGRPIQQAMSNIGGNNPGTTHRATKNQKGDPEKGKEVCRALQMDRELWVTSDYVADLHPSLANLF